MNKLYAWFRVMRPPIVFIAVFGSIAAAINFWNTSTDPIVFCLAMFAWGLLWGGIMVHNDFYDLESDRVNRPEKAVPSGAVTPFQAKYGGLAMMVLGTLIIFFIYIPQGIWHAVSSGFWALTLFIVGILYNIWGKDWGVIGHMLVAWGVAIIPFFGGAVIDPWFGALAMAPLFIYIFIAEIGREIVVCTADYFGDAGQWRTVPVRVGRRRAMYSALFFYTAAIPFYLIPYTGWLGFPKVFGPVYLWGYTIFAAGLYVMWAGAFAALHKGQRRAGPRSADDPRRKDTPAERRTWRAFEIYIRTGTRLLIIFTEFVLLAEAFF